MSGALAWFINAYQEIAQWRASIERLFTFTEEIASTCADLERAEAMHVEHQRDGAAGGVSDRYTNPYASQGFVSTRRAAAVVPRQSVGVRVGL